MSEEKKIYELIVQQGPATNPELESLLQLLREKFGLDPYTARVRLTGSGKALFGSGGREQTGKLADILRQHDYLCWVIERTEAGFAPERLRGLEITPSEVRLTGRTNTLILPKGGTVVAVLADISGKLEERALHRHAVQARYKRSKSITAMADKKMLESVLKGRPVLDLYVLNDRNQPEGAVRVFPARFDAKGLGERMTMSATLNLKAIAELAQDYAGKFSFHVDFGLGRLPGCQIKSLDGQFLNEDLVLKSLTRYGWLMCDLLQGQPEETPEEVDPTLAAVAVAAGHPVLAAAIAGGNTDALPGLNEVVKEIKEAVAEPPEDKKAATADEWLPAPPERPPKQMSARMLLSIVGSFFVVVVFMLVSHADGSLLKWFVRNGMKAGALPALFSVLLLWSGFYYVRLKRKIENTPTSRIRSLAMGMVEVHGRAVRQYALVSPVNQYPCVYYRLRKYKRDSRNRWVLKSDVDTRHVPFLIDDGTGHVAVDPFGATVKAKTTRSGLPGESMLAFHGVSTDDSNEKWIEDIIFEGTSLYVLGFAQPLKVKRKSLRERTVEKLRDLKLDRTAMQGYDTDGDGQISEGEWQAARGDAEQMALEEHLAESTAGKKQHEHAVIAKPPQRGGAFVIAETAEEAHLVRNYGVFSVPLIVGGFITAGFALYNFLLFIGY